jgi:hypothetical protein
MQKAASEDGLWMRRLISTAVAACLIAAGAAVTLYTWQAFGDAPWAVLVVGPFVACTGIYALID